MIAEIKKDKRGGNEEGRLSKGKIFGPTQVQKIETGGALVLGFAITVCIAPDVVSVVHETATKLDKATKTVVVKTADGTEHTFKVAGNATVHGAKDGFDDLKEGSEVVARCTVKGTEKRADDLGKIGKDGMKVTKGTITKVDTGTKTVVVKSADDFEYTGNAAKDMGEAVGKGTEKGTKVTVYTTRKKWGRRSLTSLHEEEILQC